MEEDRPSRDSSAGSPARRRGRPLSELTSERLRASARDLFAEAGLDGFTIAAVERRSGVPRSAIYRRWSSAQALLFDAMFSTVEGAAPLPTTGSTIGDISGGMKAFAQRLRPPGALRAARAIAAAMLTEDAAHARWEQAMDRDRANIVAALTAGGDRGEPLPALAPVVLADACIAWLVLRCVIRGAVPSDIEIDEFVSGILRR